MLSGFGLTSFDQDIASRLSRLESLDLRRKYFSEVPSSLAQMTSLRKVKITANWNLQLSDGIFNIIEGLPYLECLDLDKTILHSEARWNKATQSILSDVAARYPKLILSYDDRYN